MTESHRGLYEKYFKPSLPDDVELVTKVIDAAGEGDYESKSWQAGVVEKLVFALEHVTMNKNGIFVLSDIDIQFFKHFKTEALLQDFEDSKCDILFQRESLQKESSAINTGFYIARCSKYVEELLRDSIKLCSEQDIANDQVALNQLVLAADRGKRWGLLPTTYYARSHGFPPSGNIVLHHANMTSTIQDKSRVSGCNYHRFSWLGS